jgi:predicted nucleic acid-binding protein
MTLVDTSAWVHHLRSGNPKLVSLLERDEVLTHPFVIGELACGQIRNRREVLDLLAALPVAVIASHEDVLAFVDTHRLHGRGIGWIDAHLLASAQLSHARLLTLDSPLVRAASMTGVST